MRTEQFMTDSRFLAVLLLASLSVMAWGAVAGAATIPFQKKLGKVAIVAKSGGDYTSPVTAMNSVATWCGTPSAANPCLVKIMPGVYDLAGDSLTMRAFVDIEGSGETATIIKSTYEASYSDPDKLQGMVNGANNAEVRFLTVQNEVQFPYFAIAFANNGQSPKLTHVTVNALGGDGSTGMLNRNSSPTISEVTVTAKQGGYSCTGIINDNSSPIMSNVIVAAEGAADANTGIHNFNSSSPTMTNVTVRASGGYPTAISNLNSSPIMSNVTAHSPRTALENSSTSAVTILVDRSTFEGNNTGFFEDGGSVLSYGNVTLRIGGSKLVGTVANIGTGTLTCVNSYNGDYVALGTNCQ